MKENVINREESSPARVEHVRHECRRCGRPWCVDHISNYSWQGRRDSICDNSTRRRPSEYLNLPWGIKDNITERNSKISTRDPDVTKDRDVHSTLSALCSTRPRTWSNLVVNRLSAVRIPPLGPRLYLLCRDVTIR